MPVWEVFTCSCAYVLAGMAHISINRIRIAIGDKWESNNLGHSLLSHLSAAALD